MFAKVARVDYGYYVADFETVKEICMSCSVRPGISTPLMSTRRSYRGGVRMERDYRTHVRASLPVSHV